MCKDETNASFWVKLASSVVSAGVSLPTNVLGEPFTTQLNWKAYVRQLRTWAPFTCAITASACHLPCGKTSLPSDHTDLQLVVARSTGQTLPVRSVFTRPTIKVFVSYQLMVDPT